MIGFFRIQTITDWSWSDILPYFILLLALATIVILIVTYILSRVNDEHFRHEVAYRASGARVFRIDAQKDSVMFFDLERIATKRNCKLEDFYAGFASEDQVKVRNWVDNILSGKQTTDFLQANVMVRRSKKPCPSYLKLTKADPTHGMVHLESYLLQEGPKKVTLIEHPYVNEKDFATALKENGSENGTTFCFALRRKKAEGYDNSVPRSVCFKFRSALDHYLSGNTKLLKVADNEYIVSNLDMNDNEEATAYALRAVNGITTLLTSKNKGIDPKNYIIKAGIVSNRDAYGDPDAIIESSKRTVLNAYDTSAALSFYKRGFDDYSAFDTSKYRSEVDKIINDKRIEFFFRPIYGVSRHSVLGYMAKAVPDADKTSFGSIEELKNYAIRAKDQRNLYGYLAKVIVSRFSSERQLKSQRLIYPILLSECSTIPAIFGNLRGAKDANIVFLIDEDNLIAGVRSMGVDNTIALLKEVHEAGFSLGLCVKGKSLNSDDILLKNMDMFFVDFGNGDTNAKRMDAAIRSQLHALVERLLKYKKIIVGINLEDWNAIELVVGSGIEYVASDVFGPYAPGFVPLKEKDELRLKEMKGNRI